MSADDELRAAITAALPGASLPDMIEPGRLYRFATNGKRGDSSGWLKLFDDLRGGVFGDFRSGLSETWSAGDRNTMTRAQRVALARHVKLAIEERDAQQRRQWARNAKRIAALWAGCLPVQAGDPVALYLAHRLRAAHVAMPLCLRLHPALHCWHEGERIGAFPAMVAPLCSPDGRTVALHRTYLTPNGEKADVPTVKKLTPASGLLAGACVPLAQPVQGCIGIAEGIETALAASVASGVPTVAAYSAGNLAAWHWPPGVRRIVIFADADPAGAEAADKLRQRATLAGLSVNVKTPSRAGADWCDVWAARDAVQVEGAEA